MGQPVSVIKAFRIRSKIPNKPMKIIAELSSTHQKKTLMECSKKKKIKAGSINESWGNGGIFVNNYLTQYNSNLFFKSRMFAKEKDFKFVWFNDCKIFIKKSETSKTNIIYDETDLLTIKI